MKNKQRYLEPIFAQWLDISTSDNATRACLEGGVWADKTNYSCPRLSAAPAPSLEEDGDLDMSIYVYTVGRIRWGLCDCDLSLCQCIPCKNERTQQSELAIKVQTMPLVVWVRDRDRCHLKFCTQSCGLLCPREADWGHCHWLRVAGSARTNACGKLLGNGCW